MESLLAQRTHDAFSPGDRRRGEAYRHSGNLALEQVGLYGAWATASGSNGETYELGIDFRSAETGYLEASCDCARFSDGINCKHLWAMLRELDLQFEVPLLGEGSLDIDWCEIETLEIGPPANRRSSQPSRGRTASASRGDSNQSNTPTLAANKLIHQLTPRPQARNTRLTWKSLMNSIQAVESPQPSAAVTQRPHLQYALCLADLELDPFFRLRVYMSHRNSIGEWGAPVRLDANKQSMSNLCDDTDRRILALMEADGAYDPRYGNPPQILNTLAFRPQLLRDTLTSLCASGRFGWMAADRRPLHENRPIAFDAGPAWRLDLHIHPAEEGQVNLSPRLIRAPDAATAQEARVAGPQAEAKDNEETPAAICDLDQLVAICPTGIALFQDRISLLRAEDYEWIKIWQQQGETCLPAENLGGFLARLMQSDSPVSFTLDPSLGIVEEIAAPPRGKLKLATPAHSTGLELSATISMQYGEQEILLTDTSTHLWDESQRKILSRNREAESQLLIPLQKFPFRDYTYGYQQSEMRINHQWLGELVRDLNDHHWDVLADGLRYRSAGSFDLQVTSGQDWFDLEANIDFDGVQVTLPELLSAIKRGDRYIRLGDGTQGLCPEEWLKRLQGLSGTGEVSGNSVRYRRNQGLLLDALLQEQENVIRDRGFTTWCNKLNDFKGIQPAKQPRSFQGDMRDYQKDGLAWFGFLRKFGFGGCLADDMGLGKTIQVLALLLTRRQRRLKEGETRKPSIVVVPKSLVFNWISEAAKFAPKLKVLDYTGLDRAQHADSILDADLVVTTYGTLRNDIPRLRDLEFDYAILDEAQAIKNPAAQATKAARLLNAEHRIAMSGTPIENQLGDLWSLFDFINPGMLGHGKMGNLTAGREGNGDRLQLLSKALKPFILRRTKEQVLSELPEKTEQTLYCEMSAQQRKLYGELRDHYRTHLSSKVQELGIKRSKIHVLEALLRLRQAACDPRLIHPKKSVQGAKIHTLVEHLTEVLQENHKAIVFSQFTSLLALVKKEFDAQGWKYEYLDGKTTRRQACVERFQEQADCQLFLISLKAGGHGLNLTAADYVYILDPWWNPAVEAQAIDRAHRMGQVKPVMAYRIICRETVEEKIVDLQKSKRDLADAIISADKSLISQLSLEDLQALFA
ncbi:DEAD/DEAH box helicase [Aureliella helgolandensis]|uniref:ATP-dependent helicase HepA n=1 Tax=Aureliella helgolandensis TaxID=2527968 RepID=A0A518FZM6_9BACT|nr:DEAD/DEAH box helicase [Aureliella helgolandensis]QDV21803.1 ATP-dependent helicase HepA [Aureliella helgolandensis]